MERSKTQVSEKRNQKKSTINVLLCNKKIHPPIKDIVVFSSHFFFQRFLFFRFAQYFYSLQKMEKYVCDMNKFNNRKLLSN
jgi:hypothetical protein